MSDTVVEKKGFGTRMKNSFSGIVGGIVFVIIGIVVLIFNEKSNVVNIHDVKEIKDSYVEMKSDSLSKDNDGKLVVTSGKLDFGEETLSDTKFGVSITTPLLVRKVEVYQWKEEKEESEDKTTYHYIREWSTELEDSSKFKEKSGHTNPESLPYKEYRAEAKELKVGIYKLSSVFNSKIDTNKAYSDLEKVTMPEGYKVYGDYITNSEEPETPHIGDIRISFQYADYQDVTVMGKLSFDTITEYVTKEKTNITYLTEGTHDGAYIISTIEKGNKTMKWLLRLIGTILIIAGVKSVFGPLTALTSYVPILGRLVDGATGLISLFIGLAISLIVIAISWIFFRPILGIGLLVGAVVLIILAKKFGTKKESVPQQQPYPNNFQQ